MGKLKLTTKTIYILLREWEKKFHIFDPNQYFMVDKEGFREWFSQALDRQKEEILSKLPKVKFEVLEDVADEFIAIGYNQCLAEVKSLIKEV